MDQKQESAHERHIRVGRYLKDIVYAANDGIVTTFAVVAATVGGALSPATILIIGIANLFADGFSMAGGNYLGTKSEQEFYRKEEDEERQEIKEKPQEERDEVRAILAGKGYEGRDLDDLSRLIFSREQFWIDFMMHEELQMHAPEGESAIKASFITFVSFVAAGSIPLIPYVVFGQGAPFAFAVVGAGVALFILGALRAYFSTRSWILLGFEMLLIGGSAALISYGIGALLAWLV